MATQWEYRFIPGLGVRKVRLITFEEYDESFIKNLCLLCSNPWSTGHNCPLSQRMQMIYVDIEDELVENESENGHGIDNSITPQGFSISTAKVHDTSSPLQLHHIMSSMRKEDNYIQVDVYVKEKFHPQKLVKDKEVNGDGDDLFKTVTSVCNTCHYISSELQSENETCSAGEPKMCKSESVVLNTVADSVHHERQEIEAQKEALIPLIQPINQRLLELDGGNRRINIGIGRKDDASSEFKVDDKRCGVDLNDLTIMPTLSLQGCHKKLMESPDKTDLGSMQRKNMDIFPHDFLQYVAHESKLGVSKVMCAIGVLGSSQVGAYPVYFKNCVVTLFLNEMKIALVASGSTIISMDIHDELLDDLDAWIQGKNVGIFECEKVANTKSPLQVNQMCKEVGKQVQNRRKISLEDVIKGEIGSHENVFIQKKNYFDEVLEPFDDLLKLDQFHASLTPFGGISSKENEDVQEEDKVPKITWISDSLHGHASWFFGKLDYFKGVESLNSYHNKKVDAMNALVRTITIMPNGPFILNLGGDRYILVIKQDYIDQQPEFLHKLYRKDPIPINMLQGIEDESVDHYNVNIDNVERLKSVFAARADKDKEERHPDTFFDESTLKSEVSMVKKWRQMEYNILEKFIIIWGWYYKDMRAFFDGIDFKEKLTQSPQCEIHPGCWIAEWKIAWMLIDFQLFFPIQLNLISKWQSWQMLDGKIEPSQSHTSWDGLSPQWYLYILANHNALGNPYCNAWKTSVSS